MSVWFNPAREIDALLRKAAASVPGLEADFNPELKPSDPRHADFQANGVLAAAKKAKANPRALATALVEAVRAQGGLDDKLVLMEVAGPGFINFKLTPAALGAWLREYRDESKWRAGAARLMGGRKVVIDYPSPNTAKQMHVGHLRPIVIGEAVARLIEFCGADLVRDNHIGDWGTNFGILILAIRRAGFQLDAKSPTALEDLERLYKEGSAATKADPALMDAARAELAKLQSGDPANTALWKEIVEVSNTACQRIYDQFGLKTDVILGESFYRDKVDQVYRAGEAQAGRGKRRRPRGLARRGAPLLARRRDQDALHRPQEGRLLELRFDRPRHAPLPRRALQGRRDRLRHRRTPAGSLPSALPDRRQVVQGLGPQAAASPSRLVRHDPRRGWQGHQDEVRRARAPAGAHRPGREARVRSRHQQEPGAPRSRAQGHRQGHRRRRHALRRPVVEPHDGLHLLVEQTARL
ncbi:MAG: arginine--tRNA ligase [Verrucomicrobia bacterium]|nr:arginine--tRNA ligase [Verrucomicrobiota bacterium]